MSTLTIIIVISLLGIIVCINPFRGKPSYGRRGRASINNVERKQ